MAIILSLAASALPAISEASGYTVITTPAPLPSATAGRYYSTAINFVNTTGYPVTAAVSGLPPGLGPSSATYISDTYGSFMLTGVPSSAGSHTVTVFLTNLVGETASQSFLLTVSADGNFDVVTNFLPQASVGVPYFANIHVLYSGSFTPNAYFSGLPPGISGGAIGIISSGGFFDLPLSGTPTAGGTYNVSLFLDGVTTSASKNFTLTVEPSIPVVLPFSFSFSQNSFDFYYTIGGGFPAHQSLTFTNLTGSPINFWLTLDSRPSWLATVYNENVMTAYPGAPFGLGAGVNPAGLSPGVYGTNLRLHGGFAGSPIVIPVRLTVFGVLGTITPPLTPPLPGFADRTALMRLYHPRIDDHFYTTDVGEAKRAVSEGYRQEGNYMGYVYVESRANTEPVYRMYSARLNNHFYTTKSDEVFAAQNAGFVLEGIIGYAPMFSTSSTDKQIYRLHNARSGDHVYTTDDFERIALMNRGYVWEGSLGGSTVSWLLGTP